MKSAGKSLIFLKSSVIALGIIFLVLLIALVVLKLGKGRSNSLELSECINQVIQVDSPINKIEIDRKEIFVLTKLDKESKTQELLKLDSKCQKVITRTKFKINNVN